MSRSLLTLGCLSLLIGGSPLSAGTLDEALLRQTRGILKELHNRNIKSVGILPFRYQKGDGKPTFNAGPINHSAALRLENTLIMFADDENPKPVILHDVAQVAMASKAADWTEKIASRRKLFDLDFEPAWTGPSTKAEGFLTGLIRLGSDPSETFVRIELMTRANTGRSTDKLQFLDRIVEFRVPTDRDILREVGESFAITNRALRQSNLLQPGGKTNFDQLAVRGMQSRDGGLDLFDEEDVPMNEESEITVDGGNPDDFLGLNVKILYDGEEQKISKETNRNGMEEYFVATPKEGQKVEVVVSHTNSPDSDLIIPYVLSVNGESTWEQEQGDPLNLVKWYLYSTNHPENESGTHALHRFKGFKLPGKDEEQPWKVLSDIESEEAVASFGGKAGTIQLSVFRQFSPEPDELKISSYGLKSRSMPKKLSRLQLREKLRATSNYDFNKSTSSLGALKIDLEAPAQKVQIERIQAQGLNFRGNLTIRYYSPKSSGDLDIQN
jgi:hypothetical protein